MTRSGASKTALATQAHDNAHSPKHSASSAPKQQHTKGKSVSPTPEKKNQEQQAQQQLRKTRSKSPTLSTDQPLKLPCMST